MGGWIRGISRQQRGKADGFPELHDSSEERRMDFGNYATPAPRGRRISEITRHRRQGDGDFRNFRTAAGKGGRISGASRGRRGWADGFLELHDSSGEGRTDFRNFRTAAGSHWGIRERRRRNPGAATEPGTGGRWQHGTEKGAGQSPAPGMKRYANGVACLTHYFP